MVGEFFYKWLDRNGSIPLKCIVCNHFVAFFLRCCVKITEFACHNNKKNGSAYPVVDDVLFSECPNILLQIMLVLSPTF